MNQGKFFFTHLQIFYNTPQKSDHWLSLVKTVTLTVDYESKKKKIYSSL